MYTCSLCEVLCCRWRVASPPLPPSPPHAPWGQTTLSVITPSPPVFSGQSFVLLLVAVQQSHSSSLALATDAAFDYLKDYPEFWLLFFLITIGELQYCFSNEVSILYINIGFLVWHGRSILTPLPIAFSYVSNWFSQGYLFRQLFDIRLQFCCLQYT